METEIVIEEVVFGEFPKETAEEVRARCYMPEKKKGAGKIRRGKETPDEDLPMYVSATLLAMHSVLTWSSFNENEPPAEEDVVADDS